MPPKKKGNKKGGDDDWEAELGESLAPAAPVDGAPDDKTAEDGAEEEAAGGLMATLRKNREKRKKKGIEDDAVETEDAAAAPQEASMEDEWALPSKKDKGGKGKQADDQAAEGDDAEGGRVLTKAEKEKMKKEKEKQRKKDMVGPNYTPLQLHPCRPESDADARNLTGCEEEGWRWCRQGCGAREGR